MAMTSADKIAFAAKVQAALATAEARHPDSVAIKVLHAQFNTIALEIEALDGVASGTYGGSPGTVHPDSGGTDKGSPA